MYRIYINLHDQIAAQESWLAKYFIYTSSPYLILHTYSCEHWQLQDHLETLEDYLSVRIAAQSQMAMDQNAIDDANAGWMGRHA